VPLRVPAAIHRESGVIAEAVTGAPVRMMSGCRCSGTCQSRTEPSPPEERIDIPSALNDSPLMSPSWPDQRRGAVLPKALCRIIPPDLLPETIHSPDGLTAIARTMSECRSMRRLFVASRVPQTQ
jgi:hypothetical protein